MFNNKIYNIDQKESQIEIAKEIAEDAKVETMSNSAKALMGVCCTAAALLVCNHAANFPLMASTINPIFAAIAASSVAAVVGGCIAGHYGATATANFSKYRFAKKFLNKSQDQVK